jgi:hypothetical protein
MKKLGKLIGDIDAERQLKLQNIKKNKDVIIEVLPESNFYFQLINILPICIKIDYIPGPLNLLALQAGDYLQLLNIFPLDGLEITLKHTRLSGINLFY